MKIEGRRARIVEALSQGAEGMDAPRLRELLDSTGATPAEVRSVLDELGDRFAPSARSSIERLLAHEGARTVAPAGAGKKVHEVRAEKRRPWWSGVEAPTGEPLLHPEPTRDVLVQGERFSKDDVASLLRSLAR